MPCLGSERPDLSAVFRKFERQLMAKGCTEWKARIVAARWVRAGNR